MPEMTEATPSNSVLVGKKPVMNYVLACITLFHSGQKQVTVKARGKAISHAIDVAEVVRRKFLPDIKVKKVSIGTDKLKPQDERSDVADINNPDTTNVSTIEITLER
jgi:DNA-binding protein